MGVGASVQADFKSRRNSATYGASSPVAVGTEPKPKDTAVVPDVNIGELILEQLAKKEAAAAADSLSDASTRESEQVVRRVSAGALPGVVSRRGSAVSAVSEGQPSLAPHLGSRRSSAALSSRRSSACSSAVSECSLLGMRRGSPVPPIDTGVSALGKPKFSTTAQTSTCKNWRRLSVDGIDSPKHIPDAATVRAASIRTVAMPLGTGFRSELKAPLEVVEGILPRTVAMDEVVSVKFTPHPDQGFPTTPIVFKVWGFYGRSEKWACTWSRPAGAALPVRGGLTVEYKMWSTENPVSKIEVAELNETEPYECTLSPAAQSQCCTIS